MDNLDSSSDLYFFSSTWGPFQVHQLQLVSLSILRSTVFSAVKIQVFVHVFAFFSLCGLLWEVLFFLLINHRSDLLAGIYYYYFTPCKFFTPILSFGLPLGLNASKSSQVSRTLLNILTDLYNAVFCVVSILSQISNSFNLFSKPLATIPSVPTTIGITDTFMFHSFFSSLSRTEYHFDLRWIWRILLTDISSRR